MNGFINGIIYKNGKVKLTDNCIKKDLACSIGNFQSHNSYMEVSLIPINKSWWLSPKKFPEEWAFDCGFHEPPVWFDKKKHEKAFREAVNHWWRKHVFFRKEIAVLSRGHYLFKDCHIGEISGNVHFICQDSYIKKMVGNTVAKSVQGHSRIVSMADNAKILEFGDQSFISSMIDHASVEQMNHDTTVEYMGGSSHVKALRNRSRIYTLAETASVEGMYNQAVIYIMRGNAMVNYAECLPYILEFSGQVTAIPRLSTEALPFS